MICSLKVFIGLSTSIKTKMGRKTSTKNFRKRKRQSDNVGVACSDSELIIMHLNANGLSEESIFDIATAADSKSVNIVCVTETHLRREQNIVHHEIPGFNVFETRRSDVSEDKGGGGIAIYCRNDGPLFKLHSPAINNPLCAFVNNERLWVLCETKSYKTAVCCIYMGCNNADDRHEVWNQLIYATVSEEQNDLRRRGFRVCIVGDLNGHIGSAPGVGIVGNKPQINMNGQMILDFEAQNEYSILNRVSSGLWTRQANHHSTILDYALLSKEHYSSFKSMHIDDQGQYGGDSDHHPFFVVLKECTVVKRHFSQLMVPKPRWDISENQDWTQYSKVLGSRSGKIDTSTIDSLSRSMSAVIHSTMHDTIGIKKIKRGRASKLPRAILGELRYKKQLGHEFKILLCQHERDKVSVPGTPPSQVLVLAKELFENQREKVKLLLRERNKRIRRVNIEKCSGGTPAAQRHFWSFVTNKVKKNSAITCVQNEVSGSVKYNPDDIMLETEVFLKNLFKGQFEQIEIDPPKVNVFHNYSSSLEETPAPRNSQENLSSSDHSYSQTSSPRLSSSDQSKSPETDPAGFLDDSFSMQEVQMAIKSLHNNKARGWDNIPNECWKNAPPVIIEHLLLLFNMMKDQVQLPDKFNHGSITLIHKKGPVELLSNYRPLTINISMYGIYSRVLNNRLNTVTEIHNLLGEVQSGFRKGRCAADNIFVLNTILEKAKENGQQVHKGFVDITKAYDTISRDILWTKLENLGFGQAFISCLKTIYKDDCITTSVGGRQSRQIFLSSGVRQGCSLSPLLFALYVSDLGHELCKSGEGFDIEDVNIPALFFADDIVLLSSSAQGLKRLLEITRRHFQILKLSFSRKKSQVISESTTDFTINGDNEEEVFTLEKVLEYKYLGLETHRSLFKTIVEKQKKCILKAKQFKGACLNIAFRGPDVSFLASCLWLNVALPTILYACDSIPFSDTNIVAINRIQSQLAKCLLGVPISSPNFIAQTELGFPHFSQSLWSLQLNSYLRWRDLPPDRWPKKALMEHLSGRWRSKYFEYIAGIKEAIAMPIIYSRSDIKKSLDDFFIGKLNEEIVKAKLPGFRPVSSISRNPFISEGQSSALAVGMKVNNCRENPTQGIDKSQLCPFCPGKLASEFHVAWICPRLSAIRHNVGITPFKNVLSLDNLTGESDSYFTYINGFDSKLKLITFAQFEQRVDSLSAVRSSWISLIAK